MKPLPGLAVMLINPTSREETLYLREYLTSRDMLNVLEEKLARSKHYAGRWRDPIYFLVNTQPAKDMLDYYTVA